MLNVIIPCAVAPLIAISYEFNPSLTFTHKAQSLPEWSLVSTSYVLEKLLNQSSKNIFLGMLYLEHFCPCLKDNLGFQF